jgi:transcriptional regulator with XRE-family HTH domain
MEPAVGSEKNKVSWGGPASRSPRHRGAGVTDGRAYEPAPGTRFPSGVLGDNVRLLRRSNDMTQEELAQWMKRLGFYGWSRVSVAKIEKGTRATSVDELFALALVLKTYVAKLLDPAHSGKKGAGIDLGFPFPEEWQPEQARRIIAPEGDPWQTEREPHIPRPQYQERFREVLRKRLGRETSAADDEND